MCSHDARLTASASTISLLFSFHSGWPLKKSSGSCNALSAAARTRFTVSSPRSPALNMRLTASRKAKARVASEAVGEGDGRDDNPESDIVRGTCWLRCGRADGNLLRGRTELVAGLDSAGSLLV